MNLSPVCTGCRRQIAESQSFCPDCGSGSSLVYECPDCGRDTPTDGPACVNCGYSLSSEAHDPLAAEKADMQFDSDRLDLFEKQSDLNRREMDLHTREQRDELAARKQRDINAKIVEAEGESRTQGAKAEIAHRDQLRQLERDRVIEDEKDSSEQQREMAARQRHLQQNEYIHEYRKKRWKQKSAELRDKLEFRRAELSANNELSQAQRAAELHRLEEEHKLKLRAAKAKLETELDTERARYEAELTKQDAQFQQGLKHDDQRFGQTLTQDDQKFRQSIDHQAAAQRLDVGRKRDDLELEHDRDRREMELTMEMRERIDAIKQQEQSADHERQLQEKRLAHQHEQEKLEQLNTLNPDAMLAAMPVEQAELLARLRETEALKDLSAEQILARAADGSPDVANAFAEKFKADGGEKEQITALYERMLEQQASAGTAQTAAMKDLLTTALQTQRDTAVAATGGAAQAPPPVTPAPQGKFCSGCGSAVDPAARFCSQCAHKIV